MRDTAVNFFSLHFRTTWVEEKYINTHSRCRALTCSPLHPKRIHWKWKLQCQMHWMTPSRQLPVKMSHCVITFWWQNRHNGHFTVNILLTKICTSKHIKTNYREENTWVHQIIKRTTGHSYWKTDFTDWVGKQLIVTSLLVWKSQTSNSAQYFIRHLHNETDPAGFFSPSCNVLNLSQQSFIYLFILRNKWFTEKPASIIDPWWVEFLINLTAKWIKCNLFLVSLHSSNPTNNNCELMHCVHCMHFNCTQNLDVNFCLDKKKRRQPRNKHEYKIRMNFF